MRKKFIPKDFLNLIPGKIYVREEIPMIDWYDAENKRFTEPFFEDTFRRHSHESFGRRVKYQTSLADLEKISKSFQSIQPTGFIFHLSRCGSTLISQMFAASDENIVISEAPPVDTVIRGEFINSDERANILNRLISVFGQKRFKNEKYLFVKFDCWHAFDLELITKTFPDTPLIFLYRNPVEVIVSHLRRAGMQMIRGFLKNVLPEISFEDTLQMPAEEYCARILGRICRRISEFADNSNILLVNYNQLPDACLSEIPKHFKVNYSLTEIEKMKLAARFNAKTPQMIFEPDTKSKNDEASNFVRQAAEQFIEPYYQKLEEIRLGSNS